MVAMADSGGAQAAVLYMEWKGPMNAGMFNH